ncbi:MAG: HAD-IA family hydrolase [Pseudanabaenaceae cyanobacterium bins.68]|nr:HAD-IA family hydrolase [Pseudanabaenaceae cyanobacterium bins.68]
MNRQVIFLDAVGTLFGVRGSVGGVYAQIAQEFGVSADPQVLDHWFGYYFKSAPPMAFPGSNKSEILSLEQNWWRQLAIQVFERAEIFAQFPDFDQFFIQLYCHFATAQPWVVYADTLPALTAWRQQGISLHLVSNFDHRLYGVLDALDLHSWFDSITISTAVGAAKPSAQIFQTALDQAQVLPSQVCHIGDSYNLDYLGAIAAGLEGIWLDRSGTNSPAPHVINQLTDLA